LATHSRRKEPGIESVITAEQGASTAIYYNARVVTYCWAISALFAAIAGFNSGCSVTPVSVRETSRRPTVHGEAANLRRSPASLGKLSSGQIPEKVDLNLSNRSATKGFSRSGLVVQRIVLAENYEIKGLRHRHRTPGEGQAAVALLTPQPQSPLKNFYAVDIMDKSRVEWLS
jgi:hypothetical protein